MEFPEKLFKNNRKQYSEKAIMNRHCMFARHKGVAEWDDNDDFPAFYKIKADQSFNWNVFSIPVWVRFAGSDELVFKENYGIVSYNVKGIREKKKFKDVEKKYFNLLHMPVDKNYSHCQLESASFTDKEERRGIRMTLKHCCEVIVKPNEAYNKKLIKYDLIKMKFEQILMKFILTCQK